MANAALATSIFLAGRNNRLTWPVGIVGCVLFFGVFASARLYAEAVLQIFLVVTAVYGWIVWSSSDVAKPTHTTKRSTLVLLTGAGIAITFIHGRLLRLHTDAAAPVADSAILAFSMVAQVLLMKRRVETWPYWLFVNAIAVPLYTVRGLYLTAVLYALFLVNALISWRHWRKLAS